MTDQAKPVSRPWRRFLRFSVRGLVVLVLLIGVLMGWMARVVRTAQAQRDAVTAIKQAQGRVAYDWEWSKGQFIPGGKPWAPKWLVDLIGEDYFGHVTQVTYANRRGLSFAGTRQLLVSNERVRAQPTSASLGQPSEPVTSPLSENDAALMHLNGLTEISDLDLSLSDITDAELAHLKGLTKLSSLDLEGNAITDAGLVHLRALNNLRELNLKFSKVTDAGLAHLKGLRSLTILKLGYNRVSDAGLARLKEMSNLVFLDLDCTAVSDAGLMRLKGLPKLSELRLYGTQVTDAGVNDLSLAFPRLLIRRTSG